MLYGKPTKHIRHVNDNLYTIEPQRFIIHKFWRYKDSADARTDGDDLQNKPNCPLGSRITKHKVEMLVTPETIEPQQLYIGRIKLSFNDVLSRSICGGVWDQASHGDTATESFTADTTPITPQFYPEKGATDGNIEVANTSNGSGGLEIGGSGSGFGIEEWKLDDNIRHWINLKKVTVFDQRPLMGDRWQRIPSKVKRINEGTFYGLFIFNDSVRGATPADTQVKVSIKDYYEEMAI